MKLHSTDYYTIKLNSSYAFDDKKLLYLLYQPLVGYGAMALFETFRSELYMATKISGLCSHYRLCSLLQCTLEQLTFFRKRLEAVGLIKTYVKKHKDAFFYFYELYAPCEANQFFKDPVLHSLLKKQLTQYDYEQTISLFKIPQVKMKEELVDISASYKDVFGENLEMQASSDLQLIETKYAKINDQLDFDFITSELQANYITKQVLTKQVKHVLSQLATLYQLTESHLVNLLLFAYDNNQIDIDKLSSQALNMYTLESYQAPIEAALKTPKKQTTQDFREDFLNHSPAAFLSLKYHGAKPPRKDLKLLDELMVNFKLNAAVVNVIIDYVLRVNDGKLTAAFVQSIAATFANQQVNDLDRAMKKLKEAHQKQAIKKQTQRYARNEIVEDYQKQDKQTDSETDLQEVADLLSSL